MFLEEVDRVLEAIVGRLSLLGVGRVTSDSESVSSVVVNELESLVVLEDLFRLLGLVLGELLEQDKNVKILFKRREIDEKTNHNILVRAVEEERSRFLVESFDVRRNVEEGRVSGDSDVDGTLQT